MQNLLNDVRLHKLLEKVDRELAEACRAGGCVHCGFGNLYRGDYARKPRGILHWEKRYSFCCAREGCRKRNTPPSVRFLGRRVYVGVVVVLVSAMMHGSNPRRVKRLSQTLGIDRRTLDHWRKWWRDRFVCSPFWRAERGRFIPSLVEDRMPLGLVEAFVAERSAGLLNLMKFLAPITTSFGKEVVAM